MSNKYTPERPFFFHQRLILSMAIVFLLLQLAQTHPAYAQRTAEPAEADAVAAEIKEERDDIDPEDLQLALGGGVYLCARGIGVDIYQGSAEDFRQLHDFVLGLSYLSVQQYFPFIGSENVVLVESTYCQLQTRDIETDVEVWVEIDPTVPAARVAQTGGLTVTNYNPRTREVDVSPLTRTISFSAARFFEALAAVPDDEFARIATMEYVGDDEATREVLDDASETVLWLVYVLGHEGNHTIFDVDHIETVAGESPALMEPYNADMGEVPTELSPADYDAIAESNPDLVGWPPFADARAGE